ncbi:hypothetical protein T484DRAFT_1926861 [Baffinella frigidus]|nr:hypothetical protein T484DRAFT_1926861 [Cryptophyta sp. CCMP2293]
MSFGRAAGLVCLLLAALSAPTSSFMVPLSLSPFPMAVRPAVAAASPSLGGVRLQLRRGAASRLRMADAPSTEGASEEAQEAEAVPDSSLSDDALSARIAELGLGGETGVVDRSTGEAADVNLRPIERARKMAGELGAKAIGGAANALIGQLNKVETPIEESEWKEYTGQVEEVRPPEERTMLNSGGLVVALPVIFLGIAFALWGIGGDLGWF